MRSRAVLTIVIVCAAATASGQEPAERWWSHVTYLANDSMKGRDTGSAEHRKAAEYVADHFKRAGLAPGGSKGYFQPVPFRSRRINEEQSSLTLVRKDAVEPVVLGDEATFSMRIEPAPNVDAPLVFAGYGLQIPEAKHDDLAGLDLKGKIVVLLTGGPSHIPGPLLAHYQSTRWDYLKTSGALGTISIQNPKGQDIPWDRSKLSRFMPAVAIADQALDETWGQQVAITFNPARAEKLFTGSSHTFAELLALSNDGKVLPRFVLPVNARVKVAIHATTLQSDNVIGLLPGTDPALKNEYVVISAHLDHVGVGEPINGDPIYNGAMDNASGIATLLETAAAAAARGGFKRSVVFAAGRERPARLTLLCEPDLGGGRHYRRESQHRHVPAAVPAQERSGAGTRRIGSCQRFEARRAPARDRGAVRSRAGAQRVREKRPVQLHQDRRAGVVVEGRLHQRFGGASDRQEVAYRALSRAERRSRPARGSQSRRGFRQGLPCSRSRSRQPADAAKVE
jgi:hypothetical protein